MKRFSLCIWLSLMALTGCAANKIPESSRTMADIYAGDTANARLTREINNGAKDLVGSTREAATELTTRFPQVPNPTLTLYVFPHLTKDGLPIPGYITEFSMYASAPFALPGETDSATDVILP